jgi:diguanylate cyclase (GGDEF)-like protein
VIVTLAFLLASAFIRRSTYKRKRDVIVFVPVILTIALSLMNGFLSHEPATLLIYMIMSMAVAWSALTYIQIEFILTISIAVFTMVLLLVLTMLSDLPNPWEKSLLVVFLLVSTCGMVNARRVQNIYSYRLFLLQVRDEIRSKQMETLNTQLAGIAYTDRLTDIPNRRYFDEKIAAMRANPQAFLPLALCLIDIDHFKLLNDRLGHQQGDRCLQMVAATLRENLRTKTDLLARYGGEEFVVVLPQTEFTTAMQLIERLRLAVRSLHLPNPGAPIGQVTMSAGVAVAECTSFDPDILLEEADRALYRAKTAGRDQICI